MVANDCVALGMEVAGYDPYISVDSAWGLSREVRKALSLDSLIAESDYLSIHIPLNDKTKGIINKDKFSLMKEGVRLLNFSRGGLVNNKDLNEAIGNGTIAYYVTDFPDEDLLKNEKVIPIPHLGASTPESEENCAVMAVNQTKDFLENGNIKNSVNFPECSLSSNGGKRITIANKNIPNVIGQITHLLAEEKINITDMINKSKGDYAYNIIDVTGEVNETIIKKIKDLNEVIMVRVI